uniref:Uncharacterized protein n=1 Tax=Human betaherpesvirus 6 TaxID=10368 RepID=A0A5P9U436_9BETA|nr:hypothetical protein [Human betaherpesvirus 6]
MCVCVDAWKNFFPGVDEGKSYEATHREKCFLRNGCCILQRKIQVSYVICDWYAFVEYFVSCSIELFFEVVAEKMCVL